MNKIFKKIWNRKRGCFVAVSEAMTAASQNTGKAAVITVGLALALASTPSYAIYKHIYAGESTAGQNLDYAEQDYSLNLHGNYTVGAGSNVSWSVRGKASFNIGPDNTVTTVNGNLLLHSWHSEDLGHFTWDRSNSILVNSTGSLYIGDYDEIGNLTRGGTDKSNNLTEFRLKDSSSITINGRGFSNTTFVQEGNSVLSVNGSGMVFDGPFHINGNSRVDVHNNLQTRSNTYMTGGTINPYGNWINTGSFNLQGGNVNAGNGNLINNGTVTQTGGNFSSKLTGSGTYNYNGGSFNASKVSGDIVVNIASGLGASTSNFEGGNINNRGTLTVNGGWYKNLNNYGTANFNGNATIAKTTNYGTINSYGAVNFTDKLNTSGTLNTHDGVWSFGPSGVLAVSGGIVQTNNSFNIFDSLGTTAQQELHYVGLNSVLPQEVKSSLNDFFTKYAPGSIAQKLINHASFTGGKVIVTGVNLTQTQAADLTKAFKEQFGSATTLEFQGTIAGVSHDDKLTVAKTNELYNNVEHLRDVIFVDRKLEGENGAIVVGDSGLRNNTGFTGINEATGTTIQDGKELTLIGGKSDGTGNRFTLAEKVITAVGTGAKLILGSLGIKDSSLYQGQASEVNLSNGGELRIAAGDYLVTNHTSSGGTTTVDKNSTFRSDNGTFTDKAVLENNGETVLGALNGWNSAEVRNNGKLTVSGNTQFGGRFINNANAKLVGTADIDGTLQNSQGAQLIANTVNINGTLRNFGYMEALDNSTVFGTLENQGKLSVTDELTVGGDITNSGEVDIAKLTVQAATPVQDATAGSFINNALAKVDSLLTEAGSIVTNAADAVLTIAGLNGATELKGTLTNNGTVKVDGTQNVTVAGGELNNNGTMDNTNALNVTAGTVNNKGTLALKGLNVTGGQVTNSAEAQFKDTGTTKIEMADASDVGIANEGHLELTNLMLLKGMIQGGSVGSKGVTLAEVRQDASIEAEKVQLKELNNAGTVKATDFAAAKTENTGTVEAGHLVLAENDRFLNQATGSVKADQLVLNGGEFVNAGGNTSDIALTQLATGGQFTSDGDSTLQKVVSNEGTINLNKGNLNIAELDAKNSVYNQLGGHFKADKGFFEDSTLNIKGGIFDASEVRDSEGNVTGLLGNNTVNISGGNKTPVIDNEDSAEVKSHYKDNLTQVIAGVVNSDTTVNIMAGGVLDVAKIELDGKADSINLTGGVLQTSADQIFGSVTTEAIRIDAADAETGTVQLPTTVLSATTVGAVKDEIQSGLNVESGNLALDDDYFSASLIVSVTDKIANAFENAANLTINFLGQMTAPFTITTANDLEKEGLDVVLNPGIVLNTTTLHNEFADEYNKDTDASQTIKGLIIGAESNDPNTNSINISMGFKDVSHTDKVTIEGGKELVLVGNAVNAIPEGSFGDDANKLLKDSADGGSIDVNNGQFTFGSHGGVTPTVGWILSSNIGEDGALEAKNGEFADWTIANNGNVHVHSNAILHINSLTGNGSTVNEGKLSLDEKHGNLPVFDVTGNFLNKGQNSVLDASKVDKVTVSGTHANEGKADYNDMLIAEGGSSNNSGTEKGNILTVEGTHANSGTSIWNGVTVADSGNGENSGNLDVGSVFDVIGEFVNKGKDAVLDATKTAVTTVAGLLRNEGTANYDDMTVASGGTSNNSGFEKGDILTIADGGQHTNSGTSIWNNVSIQTGATSTVEVGGKETINGTYDIAGDRINKGEVDATGVANTQVSGTLDNQGTSNYDDMTVASGGTSNNSGYEKGDILIIEDGGEHINSGTSIWNNQTVQVGGSATTEEGGKETINDKYVIDGEKTNKGEIDATKVTDTLVSGALDNQGKSEYDDMTIQGGGTSNNSGYEKGDILTIDPNGEHNNSGTSIWNNVVVAGGDVNNTGDIETGKLTIDDGLVKIDGGSLKAEETDLNGGDLIIGNDREPTEENHVKAEINPTGDVIDTNIYVKNNGDLNLGPKGGLDWADSIGSPTVPGGTPSRLVITNNVTTGPGGGIAVGPNVWTDKDTHVQIGNGDLFFAKDSLTVIDSSILTDGKSAFNTTSDIAKVTVEPGANLVLGNIEEVGDYTIVNGYITGGNESGGMWTGGWTGDNLYALPQDGSGINWILTLHNDPSKIWVNATLADVRTVYPDIAIPNIANDDLLHCKSGDAGADFVCRVLRDKELDVAGKTKVINSVANIAFAGGAMSVSMNDLNTAADSIEGRVSMRNEAFTEYGVMREWDRGNDLWVDVIGGKQKYKSLSATGISKAGFDTNAYGLVMGYDRKFAGKSVILGAAFSYNHGSLDSTGDVLKTKNKYDSFGLHAYGAYAPVDRVNLIGTLSWMHNSSDITQSINAAGFNKANADVKTNMFSLGARAEATLPVGKANVIPHAGLRYVWAKSGSYDTKVDGKKVWGNTPDATNTFQLPIGVAVRGDIMTASGWNVRPQADLTLIPQFGDTEQKTKLSNFNGVSDKLSGEFAGKFGTNVNLGVQADKGPATFGVRYGFTGGTKGKADHAFKFEARYRF